MRKKLAALLFAACLGACSQETANNETPADTPGPAVGPETSPYPPIPTSSTAGPSGTDPMTWFTSTDGGRLRLLYSARGSDQVGVVLHCQPTDIGVSFIRVNNGDPPTTWPFALISGDQRTRLVGDVRADDVGGNMYVNAAAPKTDAVFSRLRETGMMEVADEGGGDPASYPVNAIDEAERQAIRDFFTECT